MKQLRALLPYLRPYRAAIAWGLVMVVAANALTMGSAEYVKRALDAMEGTGGGHGPGTYALLSVGVAVLAGAGRFGMREILNGVSRKVETDLRDDFFAHLLRLDASFHDAHPTGDVMSRATSDITAVRMVAGPAYMYLVNTVVFGAFAIARMAMIDPWMTAASLVPMLLLPPVTLRFGEVIHRRFEGVQAQQGILATMAQENLAGQRIVKAYVQEADQTERFRALSAESMRRNVELARTSGAFYPMLGLLAGSAMAVALWLGGRAILRGDITVGDFVLFVLYLGMLSWPMIALGWVVNLFQRGAASMGRVSAVLDAVPRVLPPHGGHAPARVRGEIELRGVSFRYPGTERWVLKDVSLRIPAGETVAVVGPTGAGKSTLVSLLARLYDPTEGEVLLDGVPLPAWDLGRLRAALAVVPQDTFLFSASLHENLALGLDDPAAPGAAARVEAAARVAQLHETAEALPSGYATVLGERGINLSGGQKQRSALARAVARDAPVLAMDDALSAVDTHTEHEILGALRGVMRGRTCVVVSHRVTAVMEADRIVVLSDGRVAEEGTHARLLAAGGLYAALQRRQLLAESVAGDGRLAPPEAPVLD